MKIEELLEKYFDGQTTCEEERALRRFFASDQVPEHLEVYRPLFACINQEVEAFQQTQKEETTPPKQPEATSKPTRRHCRHSATLYRHRRPATPHHNQSY